MADITYSLQNLFIAASFCTVAVRVSVSIICLYFWPLKHTSCLKICYGLLCPDLQWLQSHSWTMISSRSQGKIWMPYKFFCVQMYMYVYFYTHMWSPALTNSAPTSIKSNGFQMRLCDTWMSAYKHPHRHAGNLNTEIKFSHSSSVV